MMPVLDFWKGQEQVKDIANTIGVSAFQSCSQSSKEIYCHIPASFIAAQQNWALKKKKKVTTLYLHHM